MSTYFISDLLLGNNLVSVYFKLEVRIIKELRNNLLYDRIL
jgi:hypothetical protein